MQLIEDAVLAISPARGPYTIRETVQGGVSVCNSPSDRKAESRLADALRLGRMEQAERESRLEDGKLAYHLAADRTG